MATFKAVVLEHQRKEDGTWNIKIRVTQNRRCKYIATPYFVRKEDVTRSMKIKNQKYIDATAAMIRRYIDICDAMGEAIVSMSVDELVNRLREDQKPDRFDLDMVAYGRSYVEQLKRDGRAGNANAYQVALNSLVRFAGRESVSIHEITVKFLNEWMRWIMEQPARKGTVRGTRAPSLYLSQLRALHNRAKLEYNDEDAGVINIPTSPFAKVDVPKFEMPRKRALSVEQLRKLAALPYTKTLQPGCNRFNLAKDVFLLSFALVGMNAVDLYNVTEMKGDRITYCRTKTMNRRADRAEISIKVAPEIRPLIERYRDPSGERLFKFYRLYSSVATFTVALNKGLKRIGKLIGEDDLEFYAARHTWATLALNDCGIDKYVVHQALNHVDDDMKATDYYIKKSWQPIDKANRKVMNFVGMKTFLNGGAE